MKKTKPDQELVGILAEDFSGERESKTFFRDKFEGPGAASRNRSRSISPARSRTPASVINPIFYLVLAGIALSPSFSYGSEVECSIPLGFLAPSEEQNIRWSGHFSNRKRDAIRKGVNQADNLVGSFLAAPTSLEIQANASSDTKSPSTHLSGGEQTIFMSLDHAYGPNYRSPTVLAEVQRTAFHERLHGFLDSSNVQERERFLARALEQGDLVRSKESDQFRDLQLEKAKLESALWDLEPRRLPFFERQPDRLIVNRKRADELRRRLLYVGSRMDAIRSRESIPAENYLRAGDELFIDSALVLLHENLKLERNDSLFLLATINKGDAPKEIARRANGRSFHQENAMAFPLNSDFYHNSFHPVRLALKPYLDAARTQEEKIAWLRKLHAVLISETLLWLNERDFSTLDSKSANDLLVKAIKSAFEP